MPLEELEDLILVSRCNLMLAAAGLNAKAQTAEDATAICASTSVFVAAFEQLTGQRVRGVKRLPKSTADRVENCCCVLKATGAFFGLDLSHLSPEKIVSGDGAQIASLLELIVAIPKNMHKDSNQADFSRELPLERSERTSLERQKQDEARIVKLDQADRRDEDWEGRVAEGHKREPFHPSREHDTAVHEECRSQASVLIGVPGRTTARRGASVNSDSHADRSDNNDSDRSDNTASASCERTPSQGQRPGKNCPESSESSAGWVSLVGSSWEQQSDGSESDSCQSSAPTAGRVCFKGGTKLAIVKKPPSHASEDTAGKRKPFPDPASHKSDVSRVLSLVERVAVREQREWGEKQRRLGRQIADMSRRAYAPRWPFRPLTELADLRRASEEGLQSWRRSEEERLRKRKKRLVQLRPHAGRQSASVLARCRKAYRPFLSNCQVSPRLQIRGGTTASGRSRLFSKETLKQLNEVALSPTSVLDDAPKQSLQTLLQKNPHLRKVLEGSPSGKLEEALKDLPLNPGLRKELAGKVAGLEALRHEKEVKAKPEVGKERKMARQLETWAEGLVPRHQPKMRERAHMKLQDQLDLHQQKLLQIRAARFKDEVVKDQKAAAIKRAEAEELLFKSLLEKAVALEKEAILAQRREEREARMSTQRDEDSQRERAEEEIRKRCELLKEEILAKRRERMEIEWSQQQLLRQLAREERERLELERAMLLERLVVQAR